MYRSLGKHLMTTLSNIECLGGAPTPAPAAADVVNMSSANLSA
jgi:hypothetical protein